MPRCDRTQVNPEVLKNDEQLKKALADVTPQILVNAIDELLLTQLGREKGMKLNDEQFNRWLTSMRKDQDSRTRSDSRTP